MFELYLRREGRKGRMEGKEGKGRIVEHHQCPATGGSVEPVSYETYLIPGETLIPGGRGEAFHPGIGYASYPY